MWKRISQLIPTNKSSQTKEKELTPEQVLESIISKLEQDVKKAKDAFLKVQKHEKELYHKLSDCIKKEEFLSKNFKQNSVSKDSVLSDLAINKSNITHYTSLYTEVQSSSERLKNQINLLQTKLETVQTKKITLLANIANASTELELSKYFQSEEVFEELEKALYKTNLEVDLINGRDLTDIEIDSALNKNKNNTYNIAQIKEELEKKEVQEIERKALALQEKLDKKFNTHFIEVKAPDKVSQPKTIDKNTLINSFIDTSESKNTQKNDGIDDFFSKEPQNKDEIINTFFKE